MDDYGQSLQRRRLLLPARHRLPPASEELLRPFAEMPPVAAIELRHALAQPGATRDVAGIEMDMRVPGGVDVAERAVEARGLLISATKSAASKKPGWPAWILAFPDCDCTSGSHPTSSSAPVQTIRSALRARAIRLGRASMRWASCSAVVAV